MSHIYKQQILEKKYQMNTSPTNNYLIDEQDSDIEAIVNDVKNANEQWRKDANARINQYRKATMTIKVVNANDEPIEGANVSVKLDKHAFAYGVAVREADMLEDNGFIEKYVDAIPYFGNRFGFNNVLKYKIAQYPKILARAKKAVQWFETAKLTLRGHCLIWPSGNTKVILPEDKSGLPEELQQEGINTNLQELVYGRLDEGQEINSKTPHRNPKDVSDEEKTLIKKLCEYQVSSWAKEWKVTDWDVANEVRGKHQIQSICGDDVLIQWFEIAKDCAKQQDGTESRRYLNENRIVSAPDKDSSHRDKDYQDREEVEDYLQNVYQGAYTVHFYKRYVEPYRDQVVQLLLASRGEGDSPLLSGLGLQSRFQYKPNPETVWHRLSGLMEDLRMQVNANLTPEQQLASVEELQEKYGPLSIAATEHEIRGLNEDDRASITEQIVTLYFSCPYVDQFIAWYFFAPSTAAKDDPLGHHGLLWADGTLKKNGKIWLWLWNQHWTTNEGGETTNEGKFEIDQAFFGTYKIEVNYNGQAAEPAEVEFLQGGENEFTIKV
ncbi:MAG: hypothetical protein AAF383_06365 [Cyanobacteria bacterium P01_A01_bin.83]